MKKTLLTVLLLSSGLVAFESKANHDIQASHHGKTHHHHTIRPSAAVDVNNIKNPVVRTTPYTLDDMSDVAADSVIMTYKMKGVKGNVVQATAEVFTPKTAAPAGGWPIVVWAHPTTGLADDCAPSRNVMPTAIKSMITKLLAQGYVVVAPDYEGLGEPGGQQMHPYLNLKSGAYSITDAVVATRSWLKNKTSEKWVAVGHSQGGQAALGAAQYATRANLDYKGSIAVAPGSNFEFIITSGNAAVANGTVAEKIAFYRQWDVFTSMIVAGLRGIYPKYQYSQAFKSPMDEMASSAETACMWPMINQFEAAMNQYAETHNQTLDGYPRTVDNFMQQSIIRKFMDKDSQPLQVRVKTPITIYQGEADISVPVRATDRLFKQAEALGTKVNYIKNAEWTHVTAYEANIDNIVNDVTDMLSK
ncbi:alpha/beta hydrolase [Acinetobacter sp. WZC-1]|uniref:alpha/beta hydrolase n=1 Tax=Acinetobacter sp. WZC-1 TaxID=3459034 RepID=UPI00403E3327